MEEGVIFKGSVRCAFLTHSCWKMKAQVKYYNTKKVGTKGKRRTNGRIAAQMSKATSSQGETNVSVSHPTTLSPVGGEPAQSKPHRCVERELS